MLHNAHSVRHGVAENSKILILRFHRLRGMITGRDGAATFGGEGYPVPGAPAAGL
jgi:hypothetical protein